MDIPIFVISLDTEMLWGPAGGHEGLEQYNVIKRNEDKIRSTISTLLDLFEKYSITATWAIVGHLFLDHCNQETCLTNINMNKYGYERAWYKDPYSNIQNDPLYYGKDIVEKIISNPIDHEIGYHSFSHVCFTDIPREIAENEIKESKKIEKEWNIKFKSFVFPMNKIAYIDVLKKYGFKIYRGRCVGIYNDNKRNLVYQKIRRGITKFIVPSIEPKWEDGIWNIQSSMNFFDSQMPQSLLFGSKLGLERAIKEKKVFHIYLHPWSLLWYQRLKYDLEIMLKFVAKRRDEGKLYVMTMRDLAEYLNTKSVF